MRATMTRTGEVGLAVSPGVVLTTQQVRDWLRSLRADHIAAIQEKHTEDIEWLEAQIYALERWLGC